MQDQSLLHRSETQEEILLGGASSLVGQLLHPSLLQSPRSIQRMQTVQIPKRKHFYFEINLDAGPVFASQIKKLRKRFRWVEPAPLWASSYTHPLYKVQNPFSACRESKFQKENTSILRSFLMQDLSLLHRSRNSERDFVGWSQLPCGPALTPIPCTKSKIHSAHAESPTSKKRKKKS